MKGFISINSQSTTHLSQQIYDQIRSAIHTGALTAGQKLASTRSLAAYLYVSRTVVFEAYEKLLSEGYTCGVHGAGTFVRSLPINLARKRMSDHALRSGHLPSEAQDIDVLSQAVRRISAIGAIIRPHAPGTLSFRYGEPASGSFPFQLWRRLMGRVIRSDPADFMQYSDSAGLPKLRQAIARHLIASRGIYCDPDDIIVVQGAQQGLDLLSRVLLDPGDLVLMEDPGYRGAKVVFRAYGATVIGLPVDAHGVIVPRQDELPRRPKLLYCTPSHQFPTGAVLTASRRLELEDLAQHEGFFICEDDYDSEFRFRVKPIPALKGMDDADVVIHLGTFSKALFPSLRLGYILAPRRLVAPLKAMKACADLQSPTLDQATLALFISEGHYVRHLIRMRRLYARRREQIVAAIDKHFGARAKITGDEAGLHIAVEFNVDLLDHEIAEIAERAGVLVTPMSNYFVNESPERMCSSCLLGYTSISESDIDRGIQRLAAVLVPVHVAERKLLRGITREHQIS